MREKKDFATHTHTHTHTSMLDYPLSFLGKNPSWDYDVLLTLVSNVFYEIVIINRSYCIHSLNLKN